MLFQYGAVLLFLLFSIGFVLVQLVASRILAPRAPSFEKSTPYECGEIPEGTPWIRFNPRYYVIALVFLIFDVEIALMFPVAVAFKSWVKSGKGMAALFEIFAFMAILLVGLTYAWKKGYLEWVRVGTRGKNEDVMKKAVGE